MDQRWRVRRTLYDGKWATAAQSGISAPRFVLYPGPNLPTIATHRFLSSQRSARARRLCGVMACLRQGRQFQPEPDRRYSERSEDLARLVASQVPGSHK